jgi:hypothetical protein
VDYPDTTTILGAAKLTGRLRSGTSVGLLGAVTDRETARTATGVVRSTVEVAPRTVWGVGRVIQEFGGAGSTIGAHLTLVHRNLASGDALSAALVRTAITAGFDTRVRFLDGAYEGAFNVGLTHVAGDPAAVERVQRASAHYFQRVDQPRIRLDPTRRSLEGAQIEGSINKIAGRHWLWGASLQIETPEFETLDFGRLNAAGDYMGGPRITYRETRPGRFLRAYSLNLALTDRGYFDRDLGVRHTLGSNNSVTFTNFWVASLNFSRFFRGMDTQLTRGGPAMQTPLGWNITASLRNSTGARTTWNGSADIRTNEFGEAAWLIGGELAARPAPALQISVAPDFAREKGTSASVNGAINRQYLMALGGGRSETYGRRYIFGEVDRATVSTQFRVNYTFKPDVTLDLYAEPFAASGRYRGIGELAEARGRSLRMYGTDGTTLKRLDDGSYRVTDGNATFTLDNRDFNVRSFRSNVVLRWEWRPGSTLFVVWQQDRSASVLGRPRVNAADLFGAFSAPGDNVLAVKTTWWLSP